MNKEQLENDLQPHEFIGKVYDNEITADSVAINKAFAHSDYGFRVVKLSEGFAVVGKKRISNSGTHFGLHTSEQKAILSERHKGISTLNY